MLFLCGRDAGGKKDMKLTEGHYHEICDRSHIIMENIQSHLIDAYKGGDKEVVKLAEKAIDALFDLYQHAGARF